MTHKNNKRILYGVGLLGALMLLLYTCRGGCAREEGGESQEVSEDTIAVQPVDTVIPQTIDSVVPEIFDSIVEPRAKSRERRVDTIVEQPIDSVFERSVDAFERKVDSVEQKVDSIPQYVDSGKVVVENVEPMPFMTLRTNMLYDVALIPNIGVEFWLPMNFTIGADYFATWLYSDAKHIYWQGYGGYLTLRYYFGKRAAEKRFVGHHVGIYGSVLTYDVEFGGKGYQAAKPGFGGGIEYGFSLPVHECLAIDFNIGVGYQGGEYKVYRPTYDGSGHYEWLSTHRRRWFGPTKAEISLKWMISAPKKKKGGQP